MEINIDQVVFEDIVDLNSLKSLFEKFSIATGFTAGLVDNSTNNIIIATGWRDICVKFHRTCPDSHRHCAASNKELTSGLHHAGEIHIHRCENGLVDGCTPIIIQGRHFANLFSGQILFAPPDREKFRRQAQKYGYDEQKYLNSLDEVPVISEEKFTAVLRYLAEIALMTARMGLVNLKIHKKSTGREALLQSILRSAPVGIGLINDRVINWTNERMSKITGYSREEIQGQHAQMLYPDKEEFEWVGLEKYSQIKEYGIGSVDTRLKRKDGTVIDVHLSSTPIDPEDWTAGVTFTALDITERKKAANAIQESEQRLQLALEGADLGMFDWKIQTNEIYFHPRYLSMLGYGPLELPHSFATWENLLHPEEKASVRQQIFDCMENGSGKWNVEFRMRAKKGNYLWMLGRGKVVEYSRDGLPLRAAGTHLDITAAKTVETTLKDSEKRFRELFDNMSTGVAIYDVKENGKDFIFKDMNKAGLVSSQLKRHQLIGKSVLKVFPGIKKLGLFDVFQRVWKTGTPENFPNSLYQDNRITLWVENYICKIPSGEIVAIYEDITDRKKSEEELIRAQEEWSSTFDAMSDIVTIQDKNMKIVRANKAARQFFREKYGELEDKCCYELFTGKAEPCPGCPLTALLSSEESHSEIMNHDSLEKIFHVSSSPITSEDGDIQYLVHVARDVTEQKKLEEDLFQAHKMEAIGTLAGGVAHDFNNILSAIIGFSELAKDNIPPDNSAQEDLDTVLASSMRAADLVQQILTFGRKSTHHRQPFMPHLIVKEALKMLRSSLPTTLSFRENIDIDCGAILADPTKMHQIVMNLCTNAFHAMENEKGILSVSLYRKEIKAEDIPDSDVSPGPFIVLSVSDTGHGMDTETIERIFEPYFTRKEIGKGSGLGLAVVHGIVKDYKGFIQVESKPGRGSSFHVHLPAHGKSISSKIKANRNMPIGSENILTVDDERTIVNLQKIVLERLGYEVTATTDSREALREFRSRPDHFDLIIADQSMPYLSGIELAEEIFRIAPDMRIILCTGYSSVITKDGALAIGIKKYVEKPTTRSTLATLVRQVLDGDS